MGSGDHPPSCPGACLHPHVLPHRIRGCIQHRKGRAGLRWTSIRRSRARPDLSPGSLKEDVGMSPEQRSRPTSDGPGLVLVRMVRAHNGWEMGRRDAGMEMTTPGVEAKPNVPEGERLASHQPRLCRGPRARGLGEKTRRALLRYPGPGAAVLHPWTTAEAAGGQMWGET